MKIALAALTVATLLLPAGAFAHDNDSWRSGGSRVANLYERQHPRWPRAYCHTHRYPLHSDDTRHHCHNWDREQWGFWGAPPRHNRPVFDGWREPANRLERWRKERHDRWQREHRRHDRRDHRDDRGRWGRDRDRD